MAILYRAIWSDSDASLVDRVGQEFLDWAKEKSNGKLSLGGTEAMTANGPMRLQFEREDATDPDAPIRSVLHASLVETREDGSRWTTTARSWAGVGTATDLGGQAGWVWVDVEAVANDLLERVTIGAPRLVCRLLEEGTTPHRVDAALTATPQRFSGEEGAEALAALVTNVDRDLPVVVFAPIPLSFDVRSLPPGAAVADRFEDVVKSAARMAAGLAAVCQPDAEAVRTFSRIVGDAYGVRDGAFRIYLPGVDPAVDEAWRHRYTVPARFMRGRETAGQLINRAISLQAGARRPPDSYELAEVLLNVGRTQEPQELVELLDLADVEITELKVQQASLDEQYLSAIDEQQQLAEENNRLRVELNRAYKQLARTNQLGAMEPESDPLPMSAETPSEAVMFAQECLSDHLCLPDAAMVDLDLIDGVAEARAWGETSWRAFLALHAYGEAVASATAPGSFWIWCENSKHPFAWPATPKKLAMKESEGVNRTDKLRTKRVFPVDTAIDPSGLTYMEAHMKIAEGGNSLAPRIYFLASRATGRVHVGYFGPHKNVPNRQS